MRYNYKNYEDYVSNQVKRAIKSQRKTKKRIGIFNKNAQYFKTVYPDLKSILCIGARDKCEVEAFTNEGFEAVGIDLIHVDGIIQCDMSAISIHPYFRNKKFDIIYMSHSLEHCFDFEGLKNGIKYLDPKVIYIECPLRNDVGAWDCNVFDFMIDPSDKNIDKLFKDYEIAFKYISRKSKKHQIIRFILEKKNNLK